RPWVGTRGDKHGAREWTAEALRRRIGCSHAPQEPRTKHPPVERMPVRRERALIARPARHELGDRGRQHLSRERLVVVDRDEARRVRHGARGYSTATTSAARVSAAIAR